MKAITFFNNKGGVGKTSLVYHLAWMYRELGLTVLAVDLDPQANATAMFLNEERLEELWEEGSGKTIYDALTPLIKGTGDIAAPHVEQIAKRLHIIPGNLALSWFEDALSEEWPKCLERNKNERALRVESAFHRLIQKGAELVGADVVLLDVGPNLGAINRAALIASDYVVLPLAPDLFSIQGLKNLGPTLRDWRSGWAKRIKEAPANLVKVLPSGKMDPIGYLVMQHSVRDSRPVKAYQRWVNRIPSVYRQSVLDVAPGGDVPEVDKDPENLALLKHYRSLMPLAMEARKPMFALKSSDGAIGAHTEAVSDCKKDFVRLAKRIATLTKLSLS